MPYAPDIRKDLVQKDTITTSGSGAGNTVNIGFKPSFVHSYGTEGTDGGFLFGEPTGLKLIDADSVSLVSDDSNAITSYVANGFVHGTSNKFTINNKQTIFNCWKGSGNTGAVDTSGTITANVSANASVGFSLTKYTGTGSAGATIPHGLGKKPEVIQFIPISEAESGIMAVEVPNRNEMKFANGDVFIGGLGTGGTDAKAQRTNVLNSTDPTKTLITLGTNGGCNKNNQSFLAIAWRSVKGVSKAGFYHGVGNASHNMNVFIYTGFKPGLIFIKNMTTGSTPFNVFNLLYHINDNSSGGRRFTNPKGQDISFAGGTANGRDTDIYMFSNGFRIGNQDNTMGGAGQNYFYIAWAHEALVSTNNIPTVGV